jgi:hypothetical protein
MYYYIILILILLMIHYYDSCYTNTTYDTLIITNYYLH